MKIKAAISQDGPPRNFLNRFGEHVTGFLNGLDRLRFRATLRPLFYPNGPEVYLNYCKVLIFKGFAEGLSDRVKKLAYDRFQQAGRPNILFVKFGAQWSRKGMRGVGGQAHVTSRDLTLDAVGTRSCAIRRGMSKKRATAIFDRNGNI